MAASSAQRHPLLRTKDIEALPEEARVHALDSRSVRHTRSLGDAVGLGTIGVHLVRLEQGRTSSVHHFHHHDEEWVYILSGHGVAEICDAQRRIDNSLINPNTDDLVYLVGGNRLPFDVCDYPRARMRRYRTNGINEYVSWDVVKTGTKAPKKTGTKAQGKARTKAPLKKRKRKPPKKPGTRAQGKARTRAPKKERG